MHRYPLYLSVYCGENIYNNIHIQQYITLLELVTFYKNCMDSFQLLWAVHTVFLLVMGIIPLQASWPDLIIEIPISNIQGIILGHYWEGCVDAKWLSEFNESGQWEKSYTDIMEASQLCFFVITRHDISGLIRSTRHQCCSVDAMPLDQDHFHWVPPWPCFAFFYASEVHVMTDVINSLYYSISWF